MAQNQGAAQPQVPAGAGGQNQVPNLAGGQPRPAQGLGLAGVGQLAGINPLLAQGYQGGLGPQIGINLLRGANAGAGQQRIIGEGAQTGRILAHPVRPIQVNAQGQAVQAPAPIVWRNTANRVNDLQAINQDLRAKVPNFGPNVAASLLDHELYDIVQGIMAIPDLDHEDLDLDVQEVDELTQEWEYNVGISERMFANYLLYLQTYEHEVYGTVSKLLATHIAIVRLNMYHAGFLEKSIVLFRHNNKVYTNYLMQASIEDVVKRMYIAEGHITPIDLRFRGVAFLQRFGAFCIKHYREVWDRIGETIVAVHGKDVIYRHREWLIKYAPEDADIPKLDEDGVIDSYCFRFCERTGEDRRLVDRAVDMHKLVVQHLIPARAAERGNP